MKAVAYRTPKHWFKGNTHIHTTRSDGGKSPEVAELYAGAGYDFLFRTDHWVASDVAGGRGTLPASLARRHGARRQGRDGRLLPRRLPGHASRACARDMGLVAALEAARAAGGLHDPGPPVLERQLAWRTRCARLRRRRSLQPRLPAG